ncbi:MAG: FAD-dependent oxidoreductase, partial [Hyphomicrobiaceae bacterium]|nr:FAD-dependent oxidoreductase [Hyphomicrobiaceae bacterium]
MPQPNDPPNDPVVGRRWLRHASKTDGPPPSARTRTSLETQVDLCVIGAGPGGLTVAAAAAQLGMAVALIERHKMGGDCLNYGCIPSKALIAAARRAHLMRSAAPFGIRPVDPAIDPVAVHAHIKHAITAVAPNDSAERFQGLGVKVIRASAHFITRDTVLAGEQRIKARRFVIATGSSPLIPDIPGLDKVDYLTNETIFQNREKLDHLIVIGGGPIGLELAQAHLRLGSRVTVIEAGRPLGNADPELAELALTHLAAEGLDIRQNALVERVSGGTRLIDVHVTEDGKTTLLQGTHLLVAAGRKPNVSGLNLEAAGIKYDARGIKVNKGLTTSNGRVLAVGDVTGGPQFTHVANYHAGIVIRRTLFRIPATVHDSIIPWV